MAALPEADDLFKEASDFLMRAESEAARPQLGDGSRRGNEGASSSTGQAPIAAESSPYNSPESSSESQDDSSSSGEEDPPEKRFMENVLVNVGKDERHLHLGLSLMSKLFVRYGTDEVRLERLCRKYPAAAAKFLTRVFKNVLTSKPMDVSENSADSAKETASTDASGTRVLKGSETTESTPQSVGGKVTTQSSALKTSGSATTKPYSPAKLFLVEEIELLKKQTMQAILDENPELAKKFQHQRDSGSANPPSNNSLTTTHKEAGGLPSQQSASNKRPSSSNLANGASSSPKRNSQNVNTEGNTIKPATSYLNAASLEKLPTKRHKLVPLVPEEAPSVEDQRLMDRLHRELRY